MPGEKRTPAPADGVTGIGMLLLLGGVFHGAFQHVPRMNDTQDPLLLALDLFELAVLVVLPLILIVAGRWIASNAVAQGYTRSHQWTMTKWSAGGAVTIPLVIGAIKLHRIVNHGGVVEQTTQLELLAGSGLGAVLGLLVGVNVARARLQTSRLREQRDAFAFLNRALRHHVLNGTNVIQGYASEVRERLDPIDEELVDPIERRSRIITDLVHNVAAIVDTFTGPTQKRPTDLVELVAEEVSEARMAYPDARFDVNLGGVVYVEANPRLQLAIMSLIANAIEHHDRGNPRIEVGIRHETDVVVLEIADDGPGLRPHEREAAFQPGVTGDDGLGLYLVDRIVDDHGGTVAIRDNSPRGTVVSIVLPRSDPPTNLEETGVSEPEKERTETLRRFSRSSLTETSDDQT